MQTGFPNDFLWGAASAAAQVEGAYNIDGRTPSIWDVIYPGNTAFNEHPHAACDHYHRYKEDVALMKELGLKTYRFSISWSRVIPDGVGAVNPKGIAFYQSLVDELLAAGIEPIVTLYHWDLPYVLHRQGGWMNDNMPDWFAAYTKVIVDALSDKVCYWCTLNEPQCFVGLGYEMGHHAPFYKEKPSLAAITRNTLLAHGRAVLTIRAHAKLAPQIGMAPTGRIYIPDDESETAIRAAEDKTFGLPDDSFDITWFCDAPILGTFPQAVCDYLGVEQVLSAEDMKIVHQKLDFFGYNDYRGHSLTKRPEAGSFDGVFYQGCPLTTMDWSITPDLLYWAARFLYKRYHLPVLFTENGMANTDFVMQDGKVHDPQRIDFVRGYLKGIKRSLAENIPVIGYTYWSILDNYEWAWGYNKRFGLIYVDYQTQKRTLKDSALWYRDVIAANGADI